MQHILCLGFHASYVNIYLEAFDPWTTRWIPQPFSCNKPEAANIVPSAPEDGRKKRPKHVEQFCICQ